MVMRYHWGLGVGHVYTHNRPPYNPGLCSFLPERPSVDTMPTQAEDATTSGSQPAAPATTSAHEGVIEVAVQGSEDDDPVDGDPVDGVEDIESDGDAYNSEQNIDTRSEDEEHELVEYIYD